MSVSPLVLLGLVALQIQVARCKIGFCLDQLPEGLKGTGFHAASSLSQTQCSQGNHKWCPLDNTTKEWDHDSDETTPAITWYYYSGCCTNRQGRTLIADPASGLPTCGRLHNDGEMTKDAQGRWNDGLNGPPRPAEECKRWMWNSKIYNDIGFNGRYSEDHYDYYDFQIIPATRKGMSGGKYNGFTLTGKNGADCICDANSTECAKTTEDGSKCIWCKGVNTPCDDGNSLEVKFGMQFFKLHSVDLKTSLMSFQGWIRSEWYDQRLSYDYQCYGGIAAFEVQAQAGNLENSRIWVPDLELVNNDEPLWGEQFSSRLATVYSCWNGNPSRGGCGYVWWSRPAVVKALCKFGGLVKFPMDTLTCELEFSAWATTGQHQDLTFMKPSSAVSWSGKGRNQHSMAGITGGSAYQDYRIQFIETRRDITIYGCCPDPFPTLIYTIAFERSNYYYQLKLLIPSIAITTVSFIAFWLDPTVGERLGFGITTILAVIMNDVVATAMMPVCDATLLMDYISLICLMFAFISLIETGMVLNLYHRTDRSWFMALMPVGGYKIFKEITRKFRKCRRKAKGHEEIQPVALPKDRRGLFRLQLYKEIFFSLDKNHSGELELMEVESFAMSVMGNTNEGKVIEALDRFDYSGNGLLNFDEFVTFCELHIDGKDDVANLSKLLRGFVRTSDRELSTIVEMWKNRALTIDTVCRFGVPLGFILSLAILFGKDQPSLEKIMSKDDLDDQWVLKTFGFYPVAAVIVLYLCYWLYRKWSSSSKEDSLDGSKAIQKMRKETNNGAKNSTGNANGSDAIPPEDDMGPVPSGIGMTEEELEEEGGFDVENSVR